MSKIPIWPSAVCFHKGFIWFVHGVLNALFRYSYEENDLVFIGSIPGCKPICEYPYCGSLVARGDSIYIVPFYGDCVAEYNIEKNEFLRITPLINEEKSKAKYSNAFIYGNSLFCVPYLTSSDLLIINLDTYECEIQNAFKNKAINANAVYIDKIVRINDSTIVGVFGETNKLFSYDFRNGSTNVISLLGDIQGIVDSSAYVREELYIHLRGRGEFFKATVEGDGVIIKDKYGVASREVLLLVNSGEYIVADSTSDGKCYVMHELDKCTSLNLQRAPEDLLGSQTCVGVISESNTETIYFSRYSYEIYGLKSGIHKKPVLKEDDNNAIKRMIGKYKELLIREGESFGLVDFIYNC